MIGMVALIAAALALSAWLGAFENEGGAPAGWPRYDRPSCTLRRMTSRERREFLARDRWQQPPSWEGLAVGFSRLASAAADAGKAFEAAGQAAGALSVALEPTCLDCGTPLIGGEQEAHVCPPLEYSFSLTADESKLREDVRDVDMRIARAFKIPTHAIVPTERFLVPLDPETARRLGALTPEAAAFVARTIENALAEAVRFMFERVLLEGEGFLEVATDYEDMVRRLERHES